MLQGHPSAQFIDLEGSYSHTSNYWSLQGWVVDFVPVGSLHADGVFTEYHLGSEEGSTTLQGPWARPFPVAVETLRFQEVFARHYSRCPII